MAMTTEKLFGQTGGQHKLAALIDHRETYGRHVVERFARMIPQLTVAVDLGAGAGDDLRVIKSVHPGCRLVAIEASKEYASSMVGAFDDLYVADIERDHLPFAEASIDLIMANQVLEHTKEVFWIFDQVARCLKVGGHFLIGVPNIASLHNRILLLAGVQPTQHKVCSAHVRPFSKADTLKFLEACFPGGFELQAFAGAQFYPFPPSIGRPLADVFPTMAFSIFFLLRKTRVYDYGFTSYPVKAELQTNFWTGGASGQYWGDKAEAAPL